MTERTALFGATALTFCGDRSYRDARNGAVLARTVRRDQPLWRSLRTSGDVLDVVDPSGAALLSVSRIPPGFRAGRWATVWGSDGGRIGAVRPKGFVHCDFLLQDPSGRLLAKARRSARGFREVYEIDDDALRARIGTVVEPEGSVRAMGKRGVLPTSRRLAVELAPGLPLGTRLLVLALPLAIRMRHAWDQQQI